MLDEVRKALRVHKPDRELFPRQQFNFDREQYKKELDEQVRLKKLKDQVSFTKQRLLEKTLLAEDRRQANLNKTFRRDNIENLRKSFYSAVKVGLPHSAARSDPRLVHAGRIAAGQRGCLR